MDKKKVYRKAFWWGGAEHRWEAFTNWALLITVVFFAFSIYRESWFLIRFTFILTSLCFFIHCIARLCHRVEKKYHKLLHE